VGIERNASDLEGGSARRVAPSRHGAVAWFRVVAGAERLYVHVPGDDRRRTVDRGQLTHLRFRGDTLRWEHDGKARHCDTRNGTLAHCPA
jgi:hypothetical protein